MKRKPWSAQELAILRQKYSDTPSTEIAQLIGRPLTQVYQAAAKAGLRKSAAYMASAHACRLRRGDNVGSSTRFQPGQVPHNKGLRRPGYAPGRMAQTQFKPGHRSGIAIKNWRPIGTIAADPEGYLRIKIAEGKKGEPYGFGNTRIWPLLHRHLWEQHHGPIPAGHTVVFQDGDRTNVVIGNLECISRKDLMARNTVHNLPQELAQVIQLAGVLKRKLRTHAKQTERSV